MGFFLVFFPEEHHQQQLNSSKPSPTSSPTINSILKRTNSNHIFTRTQSTISICALLIFITLLLFTLSSFEPNNDFISSHQYLTRYSNKPNSPALQGLGTLYTRGTTAMNELVICHVSNLVTSNELSLFLKTFHRSGLHSRSDLLFVFDSISTIESFNCLIRDENDVFLNLVQEVRRLSGGIPASFDVTRFVNAGNTPENKEPIWGRQIKSNNSVNSSLNYGSVVGFGIGELDPENSLSGFLDSVPLSLRRWAAYPMILGRVRRKFKRVMLVDVKEVLLLGDPLTRVKNHSPESIFLYSIKPGRKSNKTHRKTVNPGFIIGGERGIRRLSGAMLTEIVRSTTRQHHSKRNVVTESVLLSQLAGNEFLQKSIRFVVSSESIPELSQLGGVEIANQTVVRRGNSNFDVSGVIMKHICSYSMDSSVYTDC